MESNKTKYFSDLEWQNRHSEFDRDHQVILLACSRKRWTWTSLEYIQTKLHMEPDSIGKAIDDLIKCQAIIAVRNDRRTYFALVERLND